MIKIAASKRGSLIATLVTASLGQAALALVGAFCVQSIFDNILAQRGAAMALELIAALFVTAALGAALLELYRAWAGEKLGLVYTAEVRAALFKRIMSASPATLGQKRQGGLLLPFVGDLTAIKKWVSDGLVRLISAAVTGTVLLGVLAIENVRLAEAAAIVVLAAAAAVIWLSGPLNAAIRNTRAKRGAVANFVSSSIRAVSTIQAFDRLEREERRLQKRNDALVGAGLRLAQLSGAMAAIVHLAATMLVGVTLVIGVIEVQRDAMSIGLVAAAISIAGLLAGAVRDLGVAWELWRRAQVSFAKISSALAIQPSLQPQDGARKLRGGAATLALEGVAAAGLFAGVNLRAAAGDIINIVGGSGAGKSMLLAIIARLSEAERGRVRINGRNLRGVSPASVRRRIGVASAATPLMRGSVAMNLRYRAPDAKPAELERVIAACGLRQVLDRLPEGDKTRLSEGAPELSRGEVQRLLIARAMLGSPAILILDEVDTHLGAEAASQIARALESYPGIVLMAATSPQLRRVANHLWRIENKSVTVEEANLGDKLSVITGGGSEGIEPPASKVLK